MCGIVGYTGKRQAVPLVLEGLKRLEYRGYDSAGIASVTGGRLEVVKAPGKISALEKLIGTAIPDAHTAIAHTRWATHGAPNEVNAHPHSDCGGVIALIHNGIIENAGSLRPLLQQRGHVFRSETDTEVLTHLVEELHTKGAPLADAVAGALQQIEGTYGIAVVSTREPETIVAARHGSPLLVAIGTGEHWVASDASAVLAHTRSVVYLDDGEIAVVRPDDYRILDLEAVEKVKAVTRIDWDLGTIERGGFAHFMLKEIMEQPESLRNTLRGRLLEEEGDVRLGGLNMTDEDLQRINRIVITACGTSWHSGLIGEYMIEEMARIPTEVEYASEFRYRNPIVDERTLVIGISQSGETADTLAALREAKRRGARTMGLVNVVGSTIAREVDGGIYLHAGPEIGVASTKAFTSQIAALALITLKLGRLRSLSILQGREMIKALALLPELVERVLARAPLVEQIAERLIRASNVLYLGRGYNFPVALEGALKLKEISYIHAEGYPAAEMKHGPIALIDDLMPVVFIAPRDAVYQKVVSNIEEVKARGGKVIAIVTEGDTGVSRLADQKIEIPETMDLLTPVLSVLPLQLLAYFIAVRRGCNVDQPRNLAKSVTVE
ncbi:MAG TPA: glutamine--fructose-6-phosphate transaminase (isomerizing) [Gemmatimonadales bacterium]|nr:glutamine--fructose-6-phosphate transaminase (isomerizing) [Gemmatimonadales bacterium]